MDVVVIFLLVVGNRVDVVDVVVTSWITVFSDAIKYLNDSE